MYLDPFDEMREFQSRMNNAFDSFFKDSRAWKSRHFMNPESHIVDRGGYLIVKVVLPGVSKEDIVLTVTESHVEVRAQKKQELKVKKKGYYRHERSYGGYYRVVPLPETVDSGSAKAVYKDGVLEVRVQKSKARKVAKKVRVD